MEIACICVGVFPQPFLRCRTQTRRGPRVFVYVFCRSHFSVAALKSGGARTCVFLQAIVMSSIIHRSKVHVFFLRKLCDGRSKMAEKRMKNSRSKPKPGGGVRTGSFAPGRRRESEKLYQSNVRHWPCILTGAAGPCLSDVCREPFLRSFYLRQSCFVMFRSQPGQARRF